MSSGVLKWIAGVASVLCVGAIVAMLNMWADVRLMKNDTVQLREAIASSVKAERIATLEAEVAAIKTSVADLKEADKALWRSRGREPG